MNTSINILCVLIIAIPFLSCDDDDVFCGSDNSEIISPGFCIHYVDGAVLDDHKDLINMVIADAIDRVNNVMPLDGITIELSAAPNRVIPEVGAGGFNPTEELVELFLDPSYPNFENVISTELGPMLVHELHHARRRRAVGYGNTLLQGSISEGLADWLSIELYGIDPPPWSVAVTGVELEDWIQTVKPTWNDPYDHSDWFFGTDPDIPRWLGYSIGYQLVKDYMDANPGSSASNLFDEPASSFEP